MKKKFFVKMMLLVLFGIFPTVVSASIASASLVDFIDVANSEPRGGVYAGFYSLEIDGTSVLGMCDDRLTPIATSWEANIFNYDDILAGAPVKFSGIERYHQVGYLFDRLEGLSYNQQADTHLAIWGIMTPGSVTLTSVAQNYYNQATSGLWDNFDFSEVMQVVTPSPLSVSQEFLIPVSAVPSPDSFLLIGVGFVSLISLRRKK